ncbi:MAG: DUF2620 domain-containing protein [Lachnospiraceae bacterium]|nr:DUF2620 domain-containing protein [Lachnospiraceae bacterium]
MMKIAIGGQLNKNEIKEEILKNSTKEVFVEIFTDTDAAAKVKSGEFDYYVGACQSGAGGALGMAYALIGREKCVTIAMAGIKPKQNKVDQAVKNGAKAFGFTNDQVDNAIPMLIAALEGRSV